MAKEMKKKNYKAEIVIETDSKELRFILEQISELCEEKDYVKKYKIVSNLNKKVAFASDAEYDEGYDKCTEAYEAELDDEPDYVKCDFEKGRVCEEYCKGFIDGYNDAKDTEEEDI